MPLKTNFFQVVGFQDILLIILPFWLYLLISEFRFAPIDQFFTLPFFSVSGGFIGNHYPLLKTLLYQGGKLLAFLTAALSLLSFGLSFSKKFVFLKPSRKSLFYVFLAIVLCSVTISGLKHFSASPCPWSLTEFGGSGEGGKCFPAGHASSGFCLLALYFALRDKKKKTAAAFLIAALFLGWIEGLFRQSQGAHFISHTTATMFWDWFVCAVLYRLILSPKRKTSWRANPVSPALYCAVTAFFLTFIFNLPFFAKACSSLSFSLSDLWLLASCGLILFFASFAVLRLFIFGPLIKALAFFLVLISAGALYFNYQFGTIINSEMMRNALATDPAEASEILTARFFSEILFLIAPQLALTFLVPIKHSTFFKGVLQALGALLLGGSILMLNFQGVSSLIRSEPVLRNLIAPVNVLSATYKAIMVDGSTETDKPREIIDPSPALGESHKQKKGVIFIVVVGETARLANWGLAGYERDTTPQLRARNVISFKKTISCGTSTDVSLPCMFSRVGRSNYDRERILREESLLPVLKRAGLNVYWVDNQSGCKGVCKGVDSIQIDKRKVPSLCSESRCMDEALLAGINPHQILKAGQTTVIFMHQLGNHGPAYWRRYPRDFEVFKPVCKDEKLNNCTREEIVNAYDNALLYTDHFLSGVIDWLSGLQDYDTGLLYVSDHGESLGENNIYLHGAPELLAPKEQKEVPMLLWLSKGFEERIGLNDRCLRKKALEEATHDELYSSLLGLLDVRSVTYDKKNDFTASCRLPQD